MAVFYNLSALAKLLTDCSKDSAGESGRFDPLILASCLVGAYCKPSNFDWEKNIHLVIEGNLPPRFNAKITEAIRSEMALAGVRPYRASSLIRHGKTLTIKEFGMNIVFNSAEAADIERRFHASMPELSLIRPNLAKEILAMMVDGNFSRLVCSDTDEAVGEEEWSTELFNFLFDDVYDSVSESPLYALNTAVFERELFSSNFFEGFMELYELAKRFGVLVGQGALYELDYSAQHFPVQIGKRHVLFTLRQNGCTKYFT